MAVSMRSVAGQQLAGARRSSTARVSRRSAVVVKAAIELKPPPYALDALEPHMKKETMEFHWGKVRGMWGRGEGAKMCV